MNICVFCSAQNIDSVYSLPALETVGAFSRRGHTLVWGGSNVGLMREVATTAQENGAPIIGISVEAFKDVAREDADEMVITANLLERKALLVKRSNAFLILPGGFGTLDEATDVIELKKHFLKLGPIVFLNTNGFYDGLRDLFSRMDTEGFLPKPSTNIVEFASTPAEALLYLGVD